MNQYSYSKQNLIDISVLMLYVKILMVLLALLLMCVLNMQFFTLVLFNWYLTSAQFFFNLNVSRSEFVIVCA